MTNYMRLYSLLITGAKIDRANRGKGLGLYANHHIYPTCLRTSKGLEQDNRPSNLVRLTHAEHYEAHRLLHLIYPEHVGLAAAYFLMSHKYSLKVDATSYAAARELVSKTLSKRNARRNAELGSQGLHHEQIRARDGNCQFQTEAFRRSQSIRTASRNARLAAEGRHPSQTPYAREAMSKWSARRLAKLAAEGKHPSQTLENRIALSKRNSVRCKQEHTCPVCKLVGKGPNMRRYHFSNCKHFSLYCQLAN